MSDVNKGFADWLEPPRDPGAVHLDCSVRCSVTCFRRGLWHQQSKPREEKRLWQRRQIKALRYSSRLQVYVIKANVQTVSNCMLIKDDWPPTVLDLIGVPCQVTKRRFSEFFSCGFLHSLPQGVWQSNPQPHKIGECTECTWCTHYISKFGSLSTERQAETTEATWKPRPWHKRMSTDGKPSNCGMYWDGTCLLPKWEEEQTWHNFSRQVWRQTVEKSRFNMQSASKSKHINTLVTLVLWHSMTMTNVWAMSAIEPIHSLTSSVWEHIISISTATQTKDRRAKRPFPLNLHETDLLSVGPLEFSIFLIEHGHTSETDPTDPARSSRHIVYDIEHIYDKDIWDATYTHMCISIIYMNMYMYM